MTNNNEPETCIDAELAERTIAVIDDLMGEAVNTTPVQNWGEVNNVLIELQKIANSGRKK